MVANVWMRIIPAQRELIAATAAGRPADWTLSDRAKRRSVHNSYVTLPVIFMMISNHYPATYGHRLNWLILVLFMVVGVGIRHLHDHPRAASPGGLGAGAGGGRAGRADLSDAAHGARRRVSAPRYPSQSPAGSWRHAARRATPPRPTDDIFRAAPNGVTFDTPESIRLRAEIIKQRMVQLKNMPLANKTGMTETERDLLARWIDQGARAD